MNEMVAVQPKDLSKRVITRLETLERKAAKSINRSNNHSYVTFVEDGQTQAISMGDMSHAGTLSDKGPFSKAGRALDKKAARVGSVFPKPKGTPQEINMQGQRVLDDILNHPDKVICFPDHLTERYGFKLVDIIVPGKGGARFTKDGKKMIGFLEPRK